MNENKQTVTGGRNAERDGEQYATNLNKLISEMGYAHFCEWENSFESAAAFERAVGEEHIRAARENYWERRNDLPELRAYGTREHVLGFVYRITPESKFCCNVGYGESARLIGHATTLAKAKTIVEKALA